MVVSDVGSMAVLLCWARLGSSLPSCKPGGERLDDQIFRLSRVLERRGVRAVKNKSQNKVSFLCTLVVGNIYQAMVAQAGIGGGGGGGDRRQGTGEIEAPRLGKEGLDGEMPTATSPPVV